MEDDQKLCEYSLPEGATISELFEPDVDINIEVSTRHQTQKLTVSNATSVMALKVQICDVIKCRVVPERLEIRLKDVTLENPVPLHFYGIKAGSQLEAVKPYVNVTLENTRGTEIYWRLNRKDTIGEVKVKLPTRSTGSEENLTDSAKVEQLRLFLVTDGQKFDELDDDKTVENCNVKEDDQLYLLSYKWTQKLKVTVKKTGRILSGCERDDTWLGVKVKAQDQLGTPVSTIKLARLVEYKWGAVPYNLLHGGTGFLYRQTYKKLTEISDEEKPFNYKEPLSVVTEEELKEDAARVEEEEKTWREKVNEMEKRTDRNHFPRLDERRKLGYQL